MDGVDRDVPDAPGCPLLGLAVDRRTRFTFAHPAHRCYAADATSVSAEHQMAYCLTVRFASCERYGAWLETSLADRR